MGVRRKSRARLAAVEKSAAAIASGVSTVMQNALVSATQHRVGQMLVTDLVFDFGTSKQTLSTQATAVNLPIGIAPAAAAQDTYLAHLTTAVFGVVTTVETVVLEQITDGTLTDFDLAYGTAAGGDKGADGYLGNAPTGVQTIATAINTNLGEHQIVGYDNNILASNGGVYLYLTAGAQTTKRASASITLTDATISAATLVSGMSAVQVQDADGTAVNFVADSSIAWDATMPGAGANKFGIGASSGTGTPACDTVKRLTYAISNAIHSHASAGTVFSTDATSRDKTGGGGDDNGATDNATTMTITHAKTGGPKTAENSTTITIVDAYSSLGATKEDFSGGIPNALTAGKLLIRLTGHVVADDL